jgi:hypothetical protein
MMGIYGKIWEYMGIYREYMGIYMGIGFGKS